MMTIEQFLKVIKALGIDPDTTTLDEVLDMLALEDPDAETEDALPPVGDGGADEATEGMPPATAALSASELAICKELNCAPAIFARLKRASASKAPGDTTDPKTKKTITDLAKLVNADPENREAILAAVKALLGLSDPAPPAAAPAAPAAPAQATARPTSEVQMLRTQVAVLSAGEHRRLCTELVTRCGRAPAAVWADDTATTPKPYLARMSVAELKAHVDEELKTSARRTPLRPPAAGRPDHAELSQDELKICEETGCDPAVYAKLKATRSGAVTA